MRRIILAGILIGSVLSGRAEYGVTAHQEGWSNIPPAAQRLGFAFQRSVLADMDGDGVNEEIMLFGHDNGHWPEFDLFKAYYAIVDNYTKEVKYMSDEILTDRYELTVEDRNNDGRSELYISYIKDGKFSTDSEGYHFRAERCHDRIEYIPERTDKKGKK